MASFPTSVKSFTTKNTGDVIQPAHVNDLQDEVNAIESGYLNGTARLNAAGSTVTSLSVTGNSTLAALQGGASTLTSLSVSGGSTIGTLEVGASTFTVRPVMPPPHAAIVFLELTQVIGSSALSTIAWTAQNYVTNSSIHSTAVTPERLTWQSTGIYQVSAQISFTSTEAGMRRVGILDSSGTEIIAAQVVASSRSNVVNLTGYKPVLNVGGYVTCALNMVGHSTMALTAGLGNTWMALVKL